MKIRFSIGVKLYIFITLVVLAVATGTSILAYNINADQIDRYYKQVTFDCAVNFSSLVDGDYLMKLRKAAETEEFQKLREKAEKNEDESLIEDYLKKNGLWEGYEKTRGDLNRYLGNMEAIKYLYIIACGDATAKYDMYLIDDDNNPMYETGYYEEREKELLGIDLTQTVEPTISTGDWGWLCSAYAPVYDSNGNTVCQVGCDFGMDEVMAERHRALLYIILTAFILTIFVLIGAVLFINHIVIIPLDSLTAEMKKFNPRENAGYEEAGVINLDIHSNDEINDLYDGIRSMQIDIIDYLNHLFSLQKDKEKAEEDIKERDEKIGQISKEVYRDSLTEVGSKAAYVSKIRELNAQVDAGRKDIAIVMVDMNELKRINDLYGHKMGDNYIIGCCHFVCERFKHSPVFRIGGDEFVVLLQGVDYNDRHALVASLKEDYKKASSNKNAAPWERYSAAVGMGELSSDDRTLDLVFKRADKAMYEDKKRYKQEHGSYR